MGDFAITTIDNPFSPFTQFDEWFSYDVFHGHRTCEKLATLANTSIYLSEEENDSEISAAIDKMIEIEPLLYKKVFENSVESFKSS